MTCPVCGGEFTKRSRVHRFCSRECKRVDEAQQIDGGPDNGPALTMQEVGTEIGVSRSRVDQIEKGALAKLRALGLKREDWL